MWGADRLCSGGDFEVGFSMTNICYFSDQCDYKIRTRDKVWIFEWSDRFGPLVITKSGKPCVHQPTAERHPFLLAVSYWSKQGKRVGDDGYCVWERPPPMVMRHLGGNHYKYVIGDDDEIDPSNFIRLPAIRHREAG